MKNLCPNGPLLELLGVSLEGIPHHKFKKLPAAQGIPEKTAVEDALKFRQDELGPLRFQFGGLSLLHIVVWTFHRKTHAFSPLPLRPTVRAHTMHSGKKGNQTYLVRRFKTEKFYATVIRTPPPSPGRYQAEKKGFIRPSGTLTKVDTPSELHVKKTLLGWVGGTRVHAAAVRSIGVTVVEVL